MSPSDNTPVEIEAPVWLGQPDQPGSFIFPTKRNKPVISKALIDFQHQFSVGAYFNISDVPCRFLDIWIKLVTRPVSCATMKLLVVHGDTQRLQTYLSLGKLHLSGEAEIDTSLPADEYTDKHWILCNQLCSITFKKLYWESTGSGSLSHKKFTLLSI